MLLLRLKKGTGNCTLFFSGVSGTGLLKTEKEYKENFALL